MKLERARMKHTHLALAALLLLLPLSPAILRSEPAERAWPAAGLILDLDADRGVTLADGDRVTVWRNQVADFAAQDFVQRDEGRKEAGSGRPTLRRRSRTSSPSTTRCGISPSAIRRPGHFPVTPKARPPSPR